jgi:CheY-like chemotaxis protein
MYDTSFIGLSMNTSLPAAAPSNASTTVLIVDDDAFSHSLLSAMLNKLGVTDIHTAANGRVGLRTLAGLPCPPDILICDVFMPDMDGIEFLNALSQLKFPGGIVLVSGEDITMMQIAQQVAGESGLKMLGAFTKPVPLADLADALGRHQRNLEVI